MLHVDEYEIKREIQMAIESLRMELHSELVTLQREIETLRQMIWNKG